MRRILAFCVVSVLASGASASPEFMGLGLGSHQVTALSGDGSTVVGGVGLAFRWTRSGGLEEIGAGSATGVSADGSTVVGTIGPFGLNDPGSPFRWTTDSGMNPLGFYGSASGVSGDGSTVVGFNAESGYAGFLWTSDGGAMPLPILSLGISADGSTVVGQEGCEASRWTSGGGTEGLGFLDPFSGLCSLANAASADGSTVVGIQVDVGGFRWTSGGGMEGIGSFTPLAVSGDGSTIVGRLGLGDFDAGAVIWDPIHGLRNVEDLLADLGIDFTGWTLASVRGISADGLTIAGEGRNPSGIPEGWIAVIPEPSTGLLLASGLAGLAALAACRRSPRNGAD